MRRLHPATILVAFLPKLVEAFRSLVPFLILSLFRGKGDTSELIMAAVGVLGGFGAVTLYLTTRYGIEGEHIVWRSGWLFKKDRRIPLANIQNVNIRQGVLERLLKVVIVEVETAAGTSSELKLQVVDQAEADRLRAELLTGSPKLENAELPEQLPERGAEDVYKVSSEDLLLGAATENNGGQIVFGLGSLIGVGALVNVIERGGSWMDMIPSSLFIWLGLALVIAVVFVGWIWGGISYALKYGGFSVRREAGAYRVSHGVLTKVQYAIRPGRIEFAEITATLFQRKLDRCTFYVGTAGSFGEQGLVAPLGLMVERDEAERALETILGRNHLSGLDWRPMPKLYIRIVLFGFARSLLLWLGLGWLITTLAQSPLVAHWTQTAISIILGLSTLGLLGTLWGIRLMRYASSDRALVFERGFFTKRLSLMPVERMEVLDVSQPVWWEGKGAARLTAVGMLHRLQVPLLASETIEALQGRLRQEYALRQDLRKGRRAAEVPFLVDDGV